METKKDKWSLICHCLHNSKYKDCKIKLFDPTKQSHILKNIDEFRCEDLSSAYHQYPLDEESMLLSGIRVFGRVLVFQTLYYGTSSAVVIVNTLNNLAASAEAIRSNLWAVVYIDDIFQSSRSNAIVSHFEDLGFYFSVTKSQMGTEVEFLGLEIDSVNKTIRISEKTFLKFNDSLKNNLMKKSDGTSCMLFEEFQKLVGILVRLSKTSVSGLVQAFSLIGKLAESQEENHKMVSLNDSDLSEIEFWSKERHLMPMSNLDIVGASIERSPVDLLKTQKKQKLDHSSDASGSYWGARSVVNGQDTGLCGKIPEELLGHPICVLEAYGAEKLVTKLLKPNTSSVIATDSTVFDSCFRKKRSSNQELNKILGRIFAHMKAHNIEVRTEWINTKEMAEWGSDSLSRKKYDQYQDRYGLSVEGVSFVEENFGKVDLDLYSSPLDNVFDTFYCSNLWVEDDSKNLRMNALQFLGSEKVLTRGQIWAFPPDGAVEMLTKKVIQLDWGILIHRIRILMVVREKRVPFVMASLKCVVELGQIELKTLQKGHKPAINLKIRSAETFVVVIFGKKLEM